MELSLYTDSVPNLSLDAALDLAASLGIKAVEIAAGGQSSAPHMRVFDLLDDPAALRQYGEKLTSRGIRMAAVNCSAWPLHPRYGDDHTRTIQAAIRLAGELGVPKIVTMSGCPGETPSSSIVNWISFAWPAQNPADTSGADLAAVLESQWQQAIAYWQEMAAYAQVHGVTKIALELHPVHLVYNTPTLLRMREAVGPVIGANVDPSHMFWQQMDPVKIVHALGPAVHHVHLKDTAFNAGPLALNGVIELNPWEGDRAKRSWVFTTIGQGHGPEFWAALVGALRAVGYDDVLSIENEDPDRPAEAGVTQAAELISGLL